MKRKREDEVQQPSGDLLANQYLNWPQYPWEEKTKQLLSQSGSSVQKESLKKFIVEDIIGIVRSQAEVFVDQKLKIDSSLKVDGVVVTKQ